MAKITEKEKREQSEQKPHGERYVRAKGGRKTAGALAYLLGKGDGSITVNEKDYKAYFTSLRDQAVASAPLAVLQQLGKLTATVHVSGGGIRAQADAVRNALAKALVALNPVFRPVMKREGFLTRDARMVERKKYGLKKARRAPQWAKR